VFLIPTLPQCGHELKNARVIIKSAVVIANQPTMDPETVFCVLVSHHENVNQT
jgi:hypothetical protein